MRTEVDDPENLGEVGPHVVSSVNGSIAIGGGRPFEAPNMFTYEWGAIDPSAYPDDGTINEAIDIIGSGGFSGTNYAPYNAGAPKIDLNTFIANFGGRLDYIEATWEDLEA